jgi:prefoldin subunit 5
MRVSARRVLRALFWGVLSLALGGALAVSFRLADDAVAKAEQAAQGRAEDYTNTTLYKALTPSIVAAPIDGREYGDVLLDVQAGILSHDDVVRVRVWNETGQLVFSSDQRDRLGQDARFDGVLRQALGGSTVSEATSQRVPEQPGLAGSNEPLLRTYVPLRLGDQTSPSVVAQIDQRYAAIRASVEKVWRPAQIGIGVALLSTFAMFFLSFRAGAGSGSGIAADPRAAERARSLERRIKDLENRLKHADERAREASERVEAVSQEREALEQRLANSEQSLRDTLTTTRANDEDIDALSARVPELELELAELRARAAAAESAPRGASPEELAEAQARAAAAEQQLAEMERQSTSSLGQAQADLDRISLRLSETQAALAEATDKRAELQADLERAQQERADTLSALEHAGVVAGERDQEVEGLRGTISERDRELERLREAVTERDRQVQELQQASLVHGAETEQVRAEVAAKSSELDSLRLHGTALATELETLRGEAVARTAELDRVRDELRRTSEVAAPRPAAQAEVDELRRRIAELEELQLADAEEVQQAHEQLAKAHLELDQTRASIEQLMGISSSVPDTMASELAEAGRAVAESDDDAAVGSRPSAFRKRRHPPKTADTPGEQEESPTTEPSDESESSEELSLSERLTRAAAARQRVSTPPDPDEH